MNVSVGVFGDCSVRLCSDALIILMHILEFLSFSRWLNGRTRTATLTFSAIIGA